MLPHIAVVGNGYWGRNLVRKFREVGALAMICDESPAAEASAREKYPEIPFTRSYADVLSDASLQAVVLATPAVTHYAMARQALDAGKDVFVEKPLALAVSEGAALVDLAARCGRILMVGHILQYHPAVRRLKDLIQAGSLGRLQYVYSNRLNIGKIRAEENILWSFAPHDISVMLALLGEEPAQVICEGGCYLNDRVADVTLSQFLFPSGVRAHVFVSWLHPFKEQRLDAVEPLKEECRHFLECVASRRSPETDGLEGIRVLRVLNACQQAMETRKAVDLAVSATRAAVSKPYFAHPPAIVGDGCEIGAGTKVWHYSHIMKGAKIGERCIFGQNCYVADGVEIGDNVKVQNNVSIYTGIVIEDDVFLGPSCVLTNVTNPRSQVNRHALYEKTVLRRGATLGANTTIVCGVELGRYSFIGAGAVVTKSVPDYALMVGNPAQQVGWMSRHGHRLAEPDRDGVRKCPESGYRYEEVAPGVLRCLDLDEEAPLLKGLTTGGKSYDEYKFTHPVSA